MGDYGRDPMLTRGTGRCRCPTCGLYFASGYAFGLHRVGKVGTPGRRCRTPEELTARGWSQIATGHWVTRARPAGLRRSDDDDPP